MNIDLTPEEIEIIKEYRQREEAKKLAKLYRLEVFRVAYEFEQWLQDNGAGSTYSTFCDDFDYKGKYDRSKLYHDIDALRQFTNNLLIERM
jgi:hypothetical protein